MKLLSKMKQGDKMIHRIFIYEGTSFDPYVNLATEKCLLDANRADSIILYLWQNDNTVVIGKGQNPWAECRCQELEENGGKLARRISGGGAVYHDLGNLNFTFIMSHEDYDIERQHAVIARACEMAGIKCEVSGRNDLLVDGRKFSGSAFYHTKWKSFHHGTILVDTNKDKMKEYLTPPAAKLESKGVKSVKSRVVNLKEINPELTISNMKKYMIAAFEEVYGMKAGYFPRPEANAIKALATEYSSWKYRYGIPYPFSVSFNGHFEWGNIQTQFYVRDGIIDTVQSYHDSLDYELSHKIFRALYRSKFEVKEMKKRLLEQLPENIANDIISMIS